MNKCVIVILVLSFVRKKKNYALACIMRKKKRFWFLVEVSDSKLFHIMFSFVAYLKEKFEMILQIV